jgi:hypothetical protein
VLSLSTAVLQKAAWLEYSAQQLKKRTYYLQKVILLSLFPAVQIQIAAV